MSSEVVAGDVELPAAKYTQRGDHVMSAEPTTSSKSVYNVARVEPLDTDDPKTSSNGGKTGRSMSSVQGSAVSFHSLNYFVKAPAPGRRCCCATADKQILHDVSGIFRPGMNAIMGPTGSGKTTLLDVLAGRTEQTGINGHILVDGSRRPKNFKCMTGYVVQDDVVMGTLTVRENLMFSANLRLPKSVSHREKCDRVTETLEELGLVKCADSKVGTEFIRGVSGGERKRTNIGMELIISPPVLFLDEPTTGLDASTANAVMSLLARHEVIGSFSTSVQRQYALYLGTRFIETRYNEGPGHLIPTHLFSFSANTCTCRHFIASWSYVNHDMSAYRPFQPLITRKLCYL
jgi:ABC-type lipoprotein export system ATPase subunit